MDSIVVKVLLELSTGVIILLLGLIARFVYRGFKKQADRHEESQRNIDGRFDKLFESVDALKTVVSCKVDCTDCTNSIRRVHGRIDEVFEKADDMACRINDIEWLVGIKNKDNDKAAK